MGQEGWGWQALHSASLEEWTWQALHSASLEVVASASLPWVHHSSCKIYFS